LNLSSLERAGSGHFPQEHQTMKAVISYLDRTRSAIGSGISAFGTRLKVGRMESVLSNLSDRQLADIGIKRGEIKHHAEYLVGYEYDGL
jgi:hypothetical protein